MSEADERAIREVIETWIAATKAGDHAKVLSLMTDDVVFLVPGQKPFGKEAFAAASQGMKGLLFEGKSTVLEIEVHGDVAFARSHIAMTITPPNAQAVHRSGYTLSVFRKQPSGAWLLARDANLVMTETAPAR
jgi:uncharacterized protein (TIGR02246 family)